MTVPNGQGCGSGSEANRHVLERPADLAVVFVHGMGDTKPGDTLNRFLNPTLEWIKRWANKDYTVPGLPQFETTLQDSVLPVELPNPYEDPETPQVPTIRRVEHTLSRSADLSEKTYVPPHAVISLAKPEGSQQTISQTEIQGGDEATWLMSEAFWAEEFSPPKFGDVAVWGLGIAPFMILRHLKLEPLGGPEARMLFLRPLRSLLWFSLGLMLIPLFELVMILLLMVGSLPVLRDRVSGIILNLIGSFGDVMMYTADPVRSTAIRTAVERCIEWTKAYGNNPTKLIIVGYSLGSLIAYDILNRQDVGANSFVTFGSPLRKAAVTLQLQRNQQRTSLGIVSAFAATIALITAFAIAFVEREHWSWTNAFIAPGFVFFLACTAVCACIVVRRFASQGWVSLLGISAAIMAVCVGVSKLPGAERDFQGIDLGITLIGVAAVLLLARSAVEAWQANSRDTTFSGFSNFLNRQPFKWLLRESTPFFLLGMLILVGYTLRVASRSLEISRDFRMDEVIAESLIGPLVLLGLVLAWSAADLPRNDAADSAPPKLKIRGSEKETIDWVDFWGSADPVVEYGLEGIESAKEQSRPKPGEKEFKILSRRITNRRSLLDHSIYNENPEQFLAPFANHLMKHTLDGWSMFADGNDSRLLESYQKARRPRVTKLGIAFWGTMAIPLLVSLNWCERFFNGKIFNESGKVHFVDDDLWGTGYLEDNQGLAARVIGLAVLFLACIIWYRVMIYPLWRSWDRAQEHMLFERRELWSLQWSQLLSNRTLRAVAFFIVGWLIPMVILVTLFRSDHVSWTDEYDRFFEKVRDNF